MSRRKPFPLKPFGIQTGQVRFWRRVNKAGPIHPVYGRCWQWIGKDNGDGYGTIMDHRIRYSTSRYSWILAFGHIPKGLHVLHRCDNRRCVNPQHLYLGDNRMNTADKVEKGREAKGEMFKSAKLTEATVREIRKRYEYGSRENGTVALAKEYGVSSSLVGAIVHGKNWKHVI